MNITYVKAPVESNMGNGFFSDGGEYIIRTIVKDKHKISTVTHNESADFLSYDSISNTDLFILGWGCVLTDNNLPRLLRPMYKQKNIISKKKKLVKELEIPSGHDPDKYITERIKAKT